MMSPVLLLLRRAGRPPAGVAQRLRDAGAIVLTGAFYESPADAVADAAPHFAFVEEGHEALGMPQFLREVENAGADLVRFYVDGDEDIAYECAGSPSPDHRRDCSFRLTREWRNWQTHWT